jgi:hypothetical protein
MKSNIDYGELQKYFELLRKGNVVAARLHNGQISHHAATVLFKKVIEEFCITYQEEKSIK